MGSNGICYRIANIRVDLLAFGPVEDPRGFVTPPARSEGLSVWAFVEIFAASRRLELASDIAIRIPEVPGYAAAKLAAWLDRSAYDEPKDARDIALALHWYAEAPTVIDRLYEVPEAIEVLLAEETDVARAAARLLGHDVARTIGPERLTELLDRWPGDARYLASHLKVANGPGYPLDRRTQLLSALSRGLMTFV